MMRRGKVPGLLMALWLTACSSTLPQTAAVSTPPHPGAFSNAAAATPTVVALNSDGPVTASMEQLQISGERYAALGNPHAPLTMVELSDFGCPFCRRYAQDVFPQIKARYIDTGKLYYVFKDFPILSLHPQAGIAAQAAECAGEQNGYWLMHAKLFERPEDWGSDPEQAQAAFLRYARDLKLDASILEQCVQEGRYAEEVERDSQEAFALGLSGTPAFLINGKLLSGARPPEQFISVLDRELAGQ